MPTYDYRCSLCDELFEVTRPIGSATKEEPCPRCESPSKRVFSPVGVHFKGSGFHNTDYKGKAADTPSCPSEKQGSKDACASCPAAKDA